MLYGFVMNTQLTKGLHSGHPTLSNENCEPRGWGNLPHLDVKRSYVIGIPFFSVMLTSRFGSIIRVARFFTRLWSFLILGERAKFVVEVPFCACGHLSIKFVGRVDIRVAKPLRNESDTCAMFESAQ